MWLSGVNQEQLGSLENEPFGVLRRREAVKQTFDAVPIEKGTEVLSLGPREIE